jgi:hypothetical protein
MATAGRKPNSSDRLKKIQLALYLDPEQHGRLKALSKETRVAAQIYLREGLDYVLDKYMKKVVRIPLRPPTSPKKGAKT